MNNELSLIYHEIDFLLPVHRFNIRFSYVTKKGLPFMREFLLRLIHLAPMSPSQVASYFDLTKREVKEALSDLIDSGDLFFLNDGTVSLTNQSSAYFSGLGTTPQVNTVLEYGGLYGFELASFQCIGTKQIKDSWCNGFALEPNLENIANSEKLAKKNFQTQFYKLLNDDVFSGLRYDKSLGKPSIYKMESIKKIGLVPLRLNNTFSMDTHGSALERQDIEIFDDASAVQDLITAKLHQAMKPNNNKEIVTAIETLEDVYTKSIICENGFEISEFFNEKLSTQLSSKNSNIFIGPIYSNSNWSELDRQLTPILNKMQKEHLDVVDEFIWLAPSDEFWGRSTRLKSCFDVVVSKAMTTEKEPKRLYKPKMYVPVADEKDKSSKNRWSKDFSNNIQHVNALVEGFLFGNVEVLMLPDRLAVVIYHLSLPEKFNVSLPIGFITTDLVTVKRINKHLVSYINGYSAVDQPRDLGPISKL